MNAMTCAEAQEQLDLLAADACDSPTREALEQHLHDCQACAALYVESRRLLALLDVHWNQAAVARLQRRIAQQARLQHRRRFSTSFVRGYVAAAAVLLIAVGLMWWSAGAASGPQLALLVHVGRPTLALDTQAAIRATGKGLEALIAPAPQREGKLPPPPAVDLDLALVNNGPRPVALRIGDAAPTLSIEVQGSGVQRLPAPAAQTPPFLQPRSLRLEPGQQHVIHVDRLIAGSPGALEYIYLTEPGAYTVIARLQLLADGKLVTVTGGPVRIQVADDR